MSEKVSIVMPVFNAEDYLEESIQGVLAQTYHNFELLCINDGSTDQSADIITKYSNIDGRVRVFSQRKQTAGAARNYGLSRAVGEYVLFLDADDFFEPDLLEKAILTMQEYSSDVVIWRSDKVDSYKNKLSEMKWTIKRDMLPDSKVFDAKDVKNVFYAFSSFPWDKMYRREYIKRVGIEFQNQENINDALFVLLSMAYAERIVTIDDVLVHKRVAEKNLTSQFYSSGNWSNWINALKGIEEHIIKHKALYKTKKDFYEFAIHMVLWNFDKFKKSDKATACYFDMQQMAKHLLSKFDIKNIEELQQDEKCRVELMANATYKEYIWREQFAARKSFFLFPYEIVPKGADIILYGAGNVGIEYYRQLIYTNYCRIILWVDQNYKTKGREVNSVEKIKDIEFDYCVIAVDSVGIKEEIIKTLLCMNIDMKKIVWRSPSIC